LSIIYNYIKKKVYCIVLILFFCSGLVPGQKDDSWKVFDDSEVAVIEIAINPEYLQWMYSNVSSDSEHVATVHFKNASIDEVIDSVGMRLRGNTSRTVNKKSFKLSFNSYFPGRRFYELDKMNLNGEHNDPSIVRSKLSWDLYGKIGMKSTRASHAAVYINGNYYGLYINVEHIDEEFLEKNFTDPSGNLWKCLYPADLTYLGADPNTYRRAQYDLKTNTDLQDYSELARFVDIINNKSGQSLKDSLIKIADVASFLKYFAMDVLTGSWDDYWFLSNNYYLYHEPVSDKIYMIPYDYDNSFGISWFDNIDWTNTNPYTFDINGNGKRPLVTSMLGVQELRNLYTHFLEFINENVFKLSNWDYDIYSIKNKITPFAVIDIYRVMDYGFSIDDFNNSYLSQHFEKFHVKNAIREFVNERYNSLKNMLQYNSAEPVIYNLDWEPKYPGPNDSIYVYASAFGFPEITNMNIEYHPGNLTMIEMYKMNYKPVVGTNIPEENDRWVGVIPPLGPNSEGRFSVSVKSGYGNSVIYPNKRLIRLSTGAAVTNELLINELMARNDLVIPDTYGDYEDWLEIFNPGNTDVNLKNKFITDSRNNPVKWRFPDDVLVPSNGTVLIWCSGDTGKGADHINFKLDGDGEFIALIDTDGSTIIDSTSFPEQKVDISWGRDADNTGLWGFMNPTPGELNTIVKVEDYINLLPKQFNVSAYPNPFNPSTTIVYELNERSDVAIEIYNTIGELVWSYFAADKYPGQYQFTWSGTNNHGTKLSSGIYLLKINSDIRFEVLKLSLVK
jgi:spore coat protein CotH